MHTGAFDPGVALRLRREEHLVRALKDIGVGAGQLVMHAQTAWASITFSGTRHSMTYAFDGKAAVESAEHFIAVLPEHEFTIPGQLVADAAVTNVDHQIEPPRMVIDVELLLLDES